MSGLSKFEVLQGLVPELEADGYEVYLNPGASLLPMFARGLSLDAVALRRDRSLVIMVLRPGEDDTEAYKKVVSMFKGKPGWDVKLHVLKPASRLGTLPVQSVEVVRSKVIELRKLADEGRLQSALLLGWAAFESCARLIAPNRFVRAQTPGRIVDTLAGDGILDVEDAAFLRQLAKARNRLAHGDFAVTVHPADVRRFAKLIDGLLKSEAKAA